MPSLAPPNRFQSFERIPKPRPHRIRLPSLFTFVAFIMLFPGLGSLSVAAQPAPNATSNILAGERVDFFTTAGQLSADGRVWSLPVHGRIYRPENSTVRKGAIALTFKTAFGVEPDRQSQMRFDERINLLLGDNKGGRRIVISIAGTTYALPLSTPDGHFEGVVEKIIPAPGEDPNPKCTGCAGAAKNQPVLGMRVINHLSRTDAMRFEDGEILDPDTGDVYRLRILVIEGGAKLDVRGYRGIALFGRSQIWRRVVAANAGAAPAATATTAGVTSTSPH